MDLSRTTPNLSLNSNASSLANRNSTFYVDLPTALQGTATRTEAGQEFDQDIGLRQQGRFESIDTFSDISDLGAARLTPPQSSTTAATAGSSAPSADPLLNVETISNFSQISDLVAATRLERADSNATDSRSLGSLGYLLDQPDEGTSTSGTHRRVPAMRKENFQLLWRSIIEIMGCVQDEDMRRACKWTGTVRVPYSSYRSMKICFFDR